MKCMILGAGSGLPHPDFHSSSLLLEMKDCNILVDCGEGVSKQLLRHGFNKDYIDAVFISHYHPDHVSGLFMLIQMLYLEGRTKPLMLFLPERAAALMETMHLFYTFEQRLTFALKVHEVSEIELFYPNVSVALTDHLVNYAEFIRNHNSPNLMQSYCFSFTEEGKSMVYTSDITTFTNLQGFLEKADYIIVDAIHPKSELIISLGKLPAKRIILSHGISESLSTWMKMNPDPHFELAREDVYYKI
jgi:ribonuclease BN (tRNA processing enzyme)